MRILSWNVNGLRAIASTEGMVIPAGTFGKYKTALQMIGIISLVLGYPVHLNYFGLDLGLVDLVHVGRLLVYLSLVFSLASAATYIRLFADAIDATKQRGLDSSSAELPEAGMSGSLDSEP